MDITPYVDSLRRDLLAAADSAGPEARAIAERLGYALDPAVRLAVMEAISQAATEITAAMPGGGVDVRLDGRDLDFVVDAGGPGGLGGLGRPGAPGGSDGPVPPQPPAVPAPPALPDEDEGLARVSLRLPESLKARADELATRAGQSLNTWLVALVRGATSERAIHVDVDLTSLPFGGDFPFGGKPGDRRMTGWL
ncbi:pilus assembly protein HicB [Pimelobacter sp. 30-1]|uniref:pilus assembly protein HicB n=1 Tax=Pimelobacter sp. 30-1 TaxID=2004991 RepID=UPI001C041E34|nr:pilus assembly protein HicB [Pimelobacter sp. 30-1]MBU2694141.1 pilus assembly protein HicB [Pimelobacter sp. 30-1]